MRTLATLMTCVVAATVALASAAGASDYSDDDWFVRLRASDTDGNHSGLSAGAQYGMVTGGSNGLITGTPDYDAPYSAFVSGAMISCFDLGAGSGNGYRTDVRAPRLDGDPIKVWNLKLWAQPDYTGSEILLSGWNPTGVGDLAPVWAFRVELWQYDALGWHKLWTVDPGVNGTSAAPNFSKMFPTVGREDAYDLFIELPMPEPTTAAALMSGLAAAVLFVRSRRRAA